MACNEHAVWLFVEWMGAWINQYVAGCHGPWNGRLRTLLSLFFLTSRAGGTRWCQDRATSQGSESLPPDHFQSSVLWWVGGKHAQLSSASVLSSRVQGSGLGCVQPSLVAKVGGEGLGQRCHGRGGAQPLLVSDRTWTFRASLNHYSTKDEDLGASSCLYTDPSPPFSSPQICPSSVGSL